MKNIERIFVSVCLFLSAGLALSAQTSDDWKVVKDKATKKFGYQLKKSNEWVIGPAFDKARKFKSGVAIVTNDKMEGLIDETGNFVLPCEFRTISVDNVNNLVHGCRYVLAGGNAANADDVIDLWGLYGLDGKEIIPPFYDSKLNFNKYGISVARYAPTGMYGIISCMGDTVLPFEFIKINKSIWDFYALDRQFLLHEFDEMGAPKNAETVLSRGYVEPYDAEGDDVKAVVYHKMFIGERMHINNLRAIDNPDAAFMAGRGRLLFTDVKDVVVDRTLYWGEKSDRFIRLFLSECSQDVPNAMYYQPTDKFYTIQAELCEPWGARIAVISEYGWIEALCNEGMIYNAQDKQQWFLSADVNMFARLNWLDIIGYRKGGAATVQEAFCLGHEDNRILESWTKCRDLKYNITLLENAGIQSYMPLAVPSSSANAIKRLESRFPVLSSMFRMGEVYRGRYTGPDDRGNASFKADPELVIPYADNYEYVNLKNTVDEVLYWGTDNRSFIKLDLLPQSSGSSSPAIVDDVFNSSYKYSLAVNLYDSYGAFVRTLGISHDITCCEADIIVLGDLGLAFTVLKPDGSGRIYFRASKEQPNSMSVLSKTIL